MSYALPLAVDQGADWTMSVTYADPTTQVPYNLTGYTARMFIKEKIGDALPLVQLTTENGKITINGAAGRLTITMANTETDTLPELAFYDLELISPDGSVTRLIEGPVRTSLGVTK